MNVLLIVDIQKTMGHWFPGSYLNKIDTFLHKNRKNYDAIYMVMEPDLVYKGTEKQSFIFKMPKGEYAVQTDEIPLFILSALSHPPFAKVYNYDYWEQVRATGQTKEEFFVQVPTQSIQGSYTLYLNEGLRSLLELLSSATQVDIIGGGLTKCVSLTEKLLTLQGIPNQVLEKYCYDIRYVNSNYRQENTFNMEPVSKTNRRILNADGMIQMVKPLLQFNL